MQLTVLRNITTVATFEIDASTIYQREVMGADKITADVVVNAPLDIQVEDHIVYESKTYTIKGAPEMTKINATNFRYVITFYSESYNLYNKLIMHEGRTSFSYTGTPLELVTLILDNVQTLDAAWAVGSVTAIADRITFNFAEQSCRTALTQIADVFGLEYYIDGKEIYLITEIGTTQAITFEYGQGNGLYNISRKNVDQGFATKWYGYGGSQNILNTYRSGLGRLTFDESPVEANIATYGTKEGSVTFENIYPKRTADVVTVPSNNSVTDNTLDFDLNAQFIPESKARIVFKTGDLAGNEFPITGYDHASFTISFGEIEEANGYVLPNDTIKAAIGDEYTLVGITMPASYVTAAEAELKTKVEAHAAANSHPRVAYDLQINEKFIRDNALTNLIQAGDRVHVTDADMSVDDDIRLQSVEWPLVNPDKITAVISETRLLRNADKVVKDVVLAGRAISDVQAEALYSRRIADAIRNYAILSKFEKTLVGDLAVLSGAFIVGNPISGEVAGVSGEGTLADAIRFFAGSSFDDRATAPYRVQHDGAAYAKSLTLEDGCVFSDDFELVNGNIKSKTGTPDRDFILSKAGAISRLCQMSWQEPIGSEYFKAGFLGINSQSENSSPTVSYQDVMAGLLGVVAAELDVYTLENIRWDRGLYGVFASSFKNLGANHQGIRNAAGTGTDFGRDTDNQVIIHAGITEFYLRLDQNYGRLVKVKNFTSLAVTVRSWSSNTIIDLSNASVTSHSLASGAVQEYLFDRVQRRWFMM